MTGAVFATFVNGGTSGGGSGGVVVPGAMAWNAIYGEDAAWTNTQPFTLITAPIPISQSKTGTGPVYYNLNGTVMKYTGAFNVSAGDALAWGVITLYGLGDKSGVITVKYGGGTTLSTIAYSVKDSGSGL